MVGVAARREVVEFIKTKDISERRGCRLISLNRKSCRYQHKHKTDNNLVKRVGELAVEYPRFGYRRIHALRGARRIGSKSKADLPVVETREFKFTKAART